MKTLVYIFSTLTIFLIGEFNSLIMPDQAGEGTKSLFIESVMDKSLALLISLIGIYFASKFIMRLLKLIMKKYEDQIDSLKREVKRKNDEIEKLKKQIK